MSALTFTSWQLTAGGLLLLPGAIWAEPALPPLTKGAAFGFGYLSPAAATLLGCGVLGQTLSMMQALGVILILASVWLGQHAQRSVSLPVARHHRSGKYRFSG